MPQSKVALRSVPSKEESLDTRSVLSRAMTVLYAFDERRPQQTLSELVRSTELPKTTVFRIVNVLVEWGALVRRGYHYEIGSRFVELASLTDVSRIREVALPFLQELHGLTRQTVHLSVLDGLDVLYIEKLGTDQRSAVPSRVGTRRPAYCTALGKALLAYGPSGLVEQVINAGLAPHTPYTITDPQTFRAELAEVYSSGVAYDRQELQLGLTCVAVPLAVGNSTASAAVSLAGPHGQLDIDRAGSLLEMVRVPLSKALQRGYRPPALPAFRAAV